MLTAAIDVLADLDRQHLHVLHLLIEELDDRPELVRDQIGHKNESDTARSQISPDRLPKGGIVDIAAESARECLFWILLTTPQPAAKRSRIAPSVQCVAPLAA